MPGNGFSWEGWEDVSPGEEARLAFGERVVKTHLFDEDIVVGVVDVEAVVVFDPGVGDVAPVITAAAI